MGDAFFQSARKTVLVSMDRPIDIVIDWIARVELRVSKA